MRRRLRLEEYDTAGNIMYAKDATFDCPACNCQAACQAWNLIVNPPGMPVCISNDYNLYHALCPVEKKNPRKW